MADKQPQHPAAPDHQLSPAEQPAKPDHQLPVVAESLQPPPQLSAQALQPPPPPPPPAPPQQQQGQGPPPEQKKPEPKKDDQKKEPPPPPKPTKRAVKIGAIVVASAFLIFLLVGLIPKHSEKKKLTERAQKSAQNDSIPEVTVSKLKRGQPVSEISLPGTIQGNHETPIYARSTGYVRKWNVDIGEKVHAGQVLAIIDAPDLDQQLVQARAQAEQSRSVLEYAKADLERWQILYRDSVVTRQELDQKAATYNADRATYEAAQAGVVRLQELVGFDRVVAPFTGVVTARNVDDGVLVTAGGGTNSTNPASLGGSTIQTPSSGQNTGAGATSTTSSGDAGSVDMSAQQSVGGTANAGSSSVGGTGGALFRIARNDTVRLYIGIPEAYSVGVQAGLDAVVHVREIPNRTFNGRVARTARAFDAGTRTLLTEVDVVNSDGTLLPGMYAQTSLRFDRSTAPVVLPASALIVRTQGAQAAVVGADSVIQMRQLQISRDLGATLEVDSGLAEGDVVVTNASDELRNGQHVRPRPEPGAGAPGGNEAGGRPANPPAAEDSSKGKKGKKNDKTNGGDDKKGGDDTKGGADKKGDKGKQTAGKPDSLVGKGGNDAKSKGGAAGGSAGAKPDTTKKNTDEPTKVPLGAPGRPPKP